MQSHRIPQNVTSYQGRILGKLTAKQFLYLAIGAIIIFLIITVIPFSMATIIISGIIGAFFLAFSLAEIEERSLDQWLLYFVTALQSTPQYIWNKAPEVPEFLNLDILAKRNEDRKTSEKMNQKRDMFMDFWKSEVSSEFTDFEKEALDRIKQNNSENSVTD